MSNGTCSVDNCERSVLCRGWCNMHYQRWSNHGDPEKLERVPGQRRTQSEICQVPTCQGRSAAHSLCERHYSRLRKLGDPALIDYEFPTKWALNQSGYLVASIKGRSISQHRYVMEQHLCRRLGAGETVHHMNGDRVDNRLENLELWSTSQPSGQRITDKVSWAIELLALYAPEALSGEPYQLQI